MGIIPKQDAYKVVYDDLMKVDLFRGHYDAKHGNKGFMNGIGTVMEHIAYKVSEDTANFFIETFFTNLHGSEAKNGKGVE